MPRQMVYVSYVSFMFVCSFFYFPTTSTCDSRMCGTRNEQKLVYGATPLISLNIHDKDNNSDDDKYIFFLEKWKIILRGTRKNTNVFVFFFQEKAKNIFSEDDGSAPISFSAKIRQEIRYFVSFFFVHFACFYVNRHKNLYFLFFSVAFALWKYFFFCFLGRMEWNVEKSYFICKRIWFSRAIYFKWILKRLMIGDSMRCSWELRHTLITNRFGLLFLTHDASLFTS